MLDETAERRRRVGDWVRNYRERHPKYTHAYISNAAGPSGPVITKIENGVPVGTTKNPA